MSGRFAADRRGISPVVGVALTLALVVVRPGDGESAVLATVEVDRPAVGPAAAHC